MSKDETLSSCRPTMVIAGSIRPGATEYGLATGFRQLGWAVQEVDRDRFGVGAGRSYPLRIAARLTGGVAISAYQDSVLAECKSLHPDILLAVKGIDLSRDVLEEVKSGKTKIVMYYPDLHFDHRGVNKDSFKCYDLFVTTKTFQVPWLKERLETTIVEHVAHGYVDGIHVPVQLPLSDPSYMCDVLYAGNHSAYKQGWLSDLLKLCPSLDIRIIGNRWKEQASTLPVQKSCLLGERLGAGYARAIQSARINIALHFGASGSEWQDLVSTRTFEIPACGGFMLHIDNDEVREYFRPGTEIDVFSSPDELMDKITFYLSNPDVRKRMAVRAYERCVPAYGYIRRAIELQMLMRTIGVSAPHARFSTHACS